MRKLLIKLTIIASLILSGCSSTAEYLGNTSGSIGPSILPVDKLPGIYRIPIQQGNLITQEMVNELRPGMTKQQVRYLLGTPLLIDTFNEDRWEYMYTSKPESWRADTPTETQRFELIFDKGRLIKITGDLYPQSEAMAKITKDKNRERTIVIPPDAPRNEDFLGFIEKIVYKATGKEDDTKILKAPTTEEQVAEEEKQQEDDQ